jgi:hypothetical protein
MTEFCRSYAATARSKHALTAELPQACVVVATCGHQARAFSAEGTVPDPALVTAANGLDANVHNGLTVDDH